MEGSMDILMIMTSAVVLGFVSLLVLWLRRRPSMRLPPGPRPLPLLGNALMLRKYGSLHGLANELKRQYGPIVTFWLFQTRCVIISSPDIIQEAMITQGSFFTARRYTKCTRILNNDHRTITTGEGERHRFLRKILVSEILTSKRVADFKPIRDKEVGILIENLRKQIKHDGDSDHSNHGRIVTNLRSLVRRTACNLLMAALIGRSLTLEEYEEVDDVLLKRFVLSMGSPREHLPLLALLPDRKGVQQQQQMVGIMTKIFQPLIEERRHELKKGIPTSHIGFVDRLLLLQSGETQQNPNTDIYDADIVVLCMDILNAGVDTAGLNLEYCIGNLINQRDIQEKLAQEISHVVGCERAVNEDDIPRLPYLQAVVKESLRRHSPARLAPSRMNSSPTKVAGYDIPANTAVFQHLEAVALSSQIWQDPLEFRPERHLNMNVDVTGSTDAKLIPFGVGRRICPAINVAFLHAELILARLIQAFHWNPVTPGQEVDLTPDVGLSSPMKYPLRARLSERLIIS